MTAQHPPRLEDTDPELAEGLRELCRINAGRKARGWDMWCLRVFPGGYTFWQGPGHLREHVVTVARNERCPCGSGRKYKKCCQYLGEFQPSNPGVKK